MKAFTLTFFIENNEEKSFIPDNDKIITSAQIGQIIDGSEEIFQIQLNDIGLKSVYGDFEIVRENGLWKTTDKDSMELNILKRSIIYAIDHKLI
jgi:hypothetical protein